jgi:Fur family ferric uptake transcriptional regulator
MEAEPERAFSIGEICDHLLSGEGGKSTVYRLVSRLVEDGRLQRISYNDSRKVCYQLVRGESCHHHMHLKCKVCGALIHLDTDGSVKFAEWIKQIKHFAIDTDAVIFGKCDRCIEGGSL